MRSAAKSASIALFAVVIGCAIMFFMLPVIIRGLYAAPDISPNALSITYMRITNVGGLLAQLTLKNNTRTSLERQEYYTLYWTNVSGVSTDCFISLGSSSVIKPGQSESVVVTPPECQGKWNSSFAFNFRPNEGLRFLQSTPFAHLFVPQDITAGYEHTYIIMGPKIDGGKVRGGKTNEPSARKDTEPQSPTH